MPQTWQCFFLKHTICHSYTSSTKLSFDTVLKILVENKTTDGKTKRRRHTVIVFLCLHRFGSDELKREFLLPSISGDKVACLGVSEVGAGSDVSSAFNIISSSSPVFLISIKGPFLVF